jgi:hypothetical protein
MYQTGKELAHSDFHIRHSASTNIVASVLIDTAFAAYRIYMFRGTTEAKGQRALDLTGVLSNLSGREDGGGGGGSYDLYSDVSFKERAAPAGWQGPLSCEVLSLPAARI